MPKRKRRPEVQVPQDYTGIGHGSAERVLWAYVDGRVFTSKTGTHESVWGEDALAYWRGRFEPETGRCSVVPPLAYTGRIVPTYLRDQLEGKFGSDIILVQFNPWKSGGKLVRRR